MRIASLLPACTEWVVAFGAAPELIGRSHECDHPDEVLDRPVLTQPAVSLDNCNSKVVDDAVRHQLQRGLSLFNVDFQRLRDLRPDLILTQEQCHVCAVPLDQVAAELSAADAETPEILSFDPQTLKQVFHEAMRLGGKLGRMQQAMQFLASGEMRLKRLQDRIGTTKKTPDAERPTVACLEWLDPPMISGNWVPDLVDLAGGRAVGSTSGIRSKYASWADFVETDPDIIAVMPCGYPIHRTIRELATLSGRDLWSDLSAVRKGRVYVFDGAAYFNRPGPRLYRSVELLAAAIHGRVTDIPVEPWEMSRITGAP